MVPRGGNHKDCYKSTNWLIIPVAGWLEVIFLREKIEKKKIGFYPDSLEASLLTPRNYLKPIGSKEICLQVITQG